MMDIKFDQSIAGPNWSAKPNDEKLGFPDDEALPLCAAGIAHPLNREDVAKVDKFKKDRDAAQKKLQEKAAKAAEKTERATAQKAETADAPASKKQ